MMVIVMKCSLVVIVKPVQEQWPTDTLIMMYFRVKVPPRAPPSSEKSGPNKGR